MTRLTKIVKREVPTRLPRNIIVSLEPGGMSAFREKGRRPTYRVTVEGAFMWAAKCHAAANAKPRKRHRTSAQ
ncbi:MAG: hypothetical protein V2A58_11325 [Planctomycetota bacterium]